MWVIIKQFRPYGISDTERKTFVFLALAWGIGVFIGNYICYRIGIMNFIPWLNNGLHTFIWIALVLTYLFIVTHRSHSIYLQMFFFFIFSFIIKHAEQLLFSAWDHDHFFFVFKGKYAYILGWSIMDSLYPIISRIGLQLFGRFISGLLR
jgi:hypothetical protein